jgi:RNA polymerase sigma factor (sigma-70 family)
MILVLFIIKLAIGYLTPVQWKNIKNLLVRPDLSQDIRNTLDKVIFHHYKSWAMYETIRFKKFHYYKCKHIPVEELNMYTMIALEKGIQKYDGIHSFVHWIRYYIKGALYQGMTDLQPTSYVSARKRMRRKKPEEQDPFQTQFVGGDDWLFDINAKKEDTHLSEDIVKWSIWNRLDRMAVSASKKKIFRYKYDDDFNVLRSNKEIAGLVGCSEENVRQILHKVKREIQKG